MVTTYGAAGVGVRTGAGAGATTTGVTGAGVGVGVGGVVGGVVESDIMLSLLKIADEANSTISLLHKLIN